MPRDDTGIEYSLIPSTCLLCLLRPYTWHTYTCVVPLRGRRLHPTSLRGDIDFLKGQYLSDTRISLDFAGDPSRR